MKKVVLDVDAGIDDALAILLALNSPELEVVGITCVSGNVVVDKVVRNVLKTVEAAGSYRPPVAVGMRKPLIRELRTAEEFHGRDGLGDSRIPESRLQAAATNAIDMLIEFASTVHPITLVCTGPLTNVASALLKDPRAMGTVQELVVMAGAFQLTRYGIGNVSPLAEFNAWVDPEAVKIVLYSGLKLTMVSLDVTTNRGVAFTKQMYEYAKKSGSDRSKFVTRVTDRVMKKHGRMALHDPIAVTVALDPAVSVMQRYHVDVEIEGWLTRGQTIVDRRANSIEWLHKPEVDVCVQIHGEGFRSLFLERVLS